MKVKHWKDIAAAAMGEQAPGVTKRVLVGPDDGAGNFAMRLFSVAPGGQTPYHDHEWEHEVFVVEGQGALVGEGGEQPLKAGDAVFVPGGTTHQFRNTGAGEFRMICVVPMQGA